MQELATVSIDINNNDTNWTNDLNTEKIPKGIAREVVPFDP